LRSHGTAGKRGRALGIVAAALAAILGLGACTADTTGDETRSLTIRAGMIPGSWDPVRTLALGEPAQAVYEPLIMASAIGIEYIPWLAESFETSDDRLTFTMEIRENVDFTDGTHLDAAAVADFFATYLEVNAASPLVVQYGAVFTAVDEYTVEVTTTTPIDFIWYDHLSVIWIVSPDAARDPEALAEKPVGTGPYLVDEYTPEVSVSFVRNPEYWNPEGYDFDEVTFQFYADELAALNALKSGQIDATSLTQIPLAVEAEAAGFDLFQGRGQYPSLFIIDRLGEVQPALADKRVRQAMNMAFDREAINESLNLGRGYVSSQPFIEGEPYYVEGGDDRYPYDPERARELMAEAGYADGFDITIPTMATYTKPYEPILQQSLADIGIRVTYEMFPDAEAVKLLTELWPSEKYPVAAYGFVHGPGIGWIDYFWGGYKTEEGLALIDTVRNGTLDESLEAEKELGEYILDEAWFVPFSDPPAYVAARSGIEVDVRGALVVPKLYQYTLAE
jgi:peptide/nickel transport system substrate-binding protein